LHGSLSPFPVLLFCFSFHTGSSTYTSPALAPFIPAFCSSTLFIFLQFLSHQSRQYCHSQLPQHLPSSRYYPSECLPIPFYVCYLMLLSIPILGLPQTCVFQSPFTLLSRINDGSNYAAAKLTLPFLLS